MCHVCYHQPTPCSATTLLVRLSGNRIALLPGRLTRRIGAAGRRPVFLQRNTIQPRSGLLVLLALLVSGIAAASSSAPPLPLHRVSDADGTFEIDGRLKEPFWKTITPVTDFKVLEPDTLQPARHASRLYLGYDLKGLYIGAELEQPRDTLVSRLSGRDLIQLNRDNLSITIDTSGEGLYGNWFGIALGDSLMDGTVLPERKYQNDWDGPWRGRTRKTRTGWTAEMFIPWSAVSMPASGDLRRMGIYVSRKVGYLDERWGWPELPPTRQKFMSDLQTITMEGIAPRQQYNIYPFAAVARDRVDGDTKYRAGVDLFWRPSTNFQMNATLNPDFGNVESDEVVINLTALEVFFPEKRLFFLEGQEVYVTSPRGDTRTRSSVGNQGVPYTLLNTRRIGGKPRRPNVPAAAFIPQRELEAPTELKGAINTTGQSGRLRYGFLAAFEDDVKFHTRQGGTPVNLHQDGNDYGVARVLYENNDSGYRAAGAMVTSVLNDYRDAITYGLDGHWLSPTGRIKVDGQYMGSDVEGSTRGHGGFVDMELLLRRGMFYRVGVEAFDKHLDVNDLGFLQRVDMYRFRNSFTLTSSGLGFARENQFDVRGFLQKNFSESLLTGAGIFFSDRLSLNNLSFLTSRLSWLPEQYDDLNSFGNGTFRTEERLEASLLWESDTTRRWFYTAGLGFKNENLGGDSLVWDASIGWRPSDRFGVTLAVQYQDRHEWLLHQGGRLMGTFDAEQWMPNLSVDFFLNARQQLRLSMQVVGIKAREQAFYFIPARPGDLVATAKPVGPGFRANYDFSKTQYSLQIRYRWELAPLSDLFVVYTRQADLGALLGSQDFGQVFNDAWDAPLANFLVVKLRYRLGS